MLIKVANLPTKMFHIESHPTRLIRARTVGIGMECGHSAAHELRRDYKA